MSTHLFLTINSVGTILCPFYEGRIEGTEEINPLSKITTGKRQGLGFELRQLENQYILWPPQQFLPVILPSCHEVQMSWWMIKHLEKHKIIMQTQGVLWTAGSFLDTQMTVGFDFLINLKASLSGRGREYRSNQTLRTSYMFPLCPFIALISSLLNSGALICRISTGYGN